MADDGRYPKYKTVDGFILPPPFQADVFREALKYEAQDDDVFIMTFPKNGTTWVQMIVYLMHRDGQPPNSGKDLYDCSPFMEYVGKERTENRVRPGAIKAHLPYHLTPRSDKAKYIFVLRNPKDTVVSFFHHTKHRPYGFENGDFDTYFDIFMKGENDVGDYFDFILSWYEHRHDPNVLFVYYEDMKKNVRKEILRLANFIDPDIGTKIDGNPDILELIVQNSSFQAMKFLNKGFQSPIKPVEGESDKPEDNKDFVRKGIVGDWRSTFTDEQNERMNLKIEEKLKGTEMYTFWKDGDYL